jgi:hypothetical protein
MLVGKGGMRDQGARCSVVSRRGRGGRVARTTQAASNVGQVGMEACCGCEEVEHDLNKSERLVAVGEVPGGGEELRMESQGRAPGGASIAVNVIRPGEGSKLIVNNLGCSMRRECPAVRRMAALPVERGRLLFASRSATLSRSITPPTPAETWSRPTRRR